MITKEELKNYINLRRLKNLGQAEKDYFQNIILFIIYQSYGNELVFKGGTALNKCYGLDRFSEDLDFTCQNKIDIKNLEDGMKRFKLEFENETKEYSNGLKITLRIKGPLYIGMRHSLCKFIIDLSFRENVMLKPEIRTIGRFLEEIPSFDVFVMQEKEILAEKARAIVSRNKARDVYDFWFLLKKGVNLDVALVKEKFRYYKQEWDEKQFIKKVGEKKKVWKTELQPLVPSVPNFNEVKSYIAEKISKIV